MSDEEVVEPGAEEPQLWDELVEWGTRFRREPRFEEAERHYKIRLAQQLQAARQALVDGGPWQGLLRKAIRSKDQNIMRFNQSGPFLDWVQSQPGDAVLALDKIWNVDIDPLARIEAFCAAFPTSVLKGQGMRTTLASVLVMADDPTSLPPYRPRLLQSGYRITGYPPNSGGTEADEYRHALGFFDEVMLQFENAGAPLLDRLDAQGVLWAMLKWSVPEQWADEDQRRLVEYRGESPRTWWVNQGQSYERELADGYVFASMADQAGRVPAGYANVSRLTRGDLIVHYAGRAVRAVSEVMANPQFAARPDGDQQIEGRLARVRYQQLERPIAFDEIPPEIRDKDSGPFDRNGNPMQSYLSPLREPFAQRLRNAFSGRWPEGSRWDEEPVGHWLFQANPENYNLAEVLSEMEPGEELSYSVNRFLDRYRIGDAVALWQSGSSAGIYGLAKVIQGPHESDRETWRGGESGSGPHTDVALEITAVVDPPLLRTELQDHPVLRDLAVIRAPQGTNYEVTGKQWEALLDMASGGPLNEEEDVGSEWALPSLAEIAATIRAEGMRIDDRALRRFHDSLRTRGFVVLSGLSGTGKTWLAGAYADAVGARKCVVAVAPNWTSNEDLLGWQSPLSGTYQHTEFSSFLVEAAAEVERAEANNSQARPYVLILDEMNLARVEHYFAKFLSAMETRSREGSTALPLGPGLVTRLYPNLWFVGTVNVDETTHQFADKVHDRAQLIEMTIDRAAVEAHLGSRPYAPAVLEVWDAVSRIKPFAYRVIDEFERYSQSVLESGGTLEEALDDLIVQKVLPKLTGASPQLGEALQALSELCRDQYQLSHEKVERMLADYRTHGFASFF